MATDRRQPGRGYVAAWTDRKTVGSAAQKPDAAGETIPDHAIPDVLNRTTMVVSAAWTAWNGVMARFANEPDSFIKTPASVALLNPNSRTEPARQAQTLELVRLLPWIRPLVLGCMWTLTSAF